MKQTHSLLLLTCLGALLLAGCKHDVKTPEPLAMAQIPTAVQAAFTNTTGDVAQKSEILLSKVSAGSNIDALAAADDLLKSNLSAKQRDTLLRCRLTIYTAIQEAAEKGDQQAVQEINYRHATK